MYIAVIIPVYYGMPSVVHCAPYVIRHGRRAASAEHRRREQSGEAGIFFLHYKNLPYTNTGGGTEKVVPDPPREIFIIS